MNADARLHLVMFVIWFSLAFLLGLRLAVLGNEEQSLANARGARLTERTDLAFENDRQRSRLDVEASAPALDEAIRSLGLPLQPPAVASR